MSSVHVFCCAGRYFKYSVFKGILVSINWTQGLTVLITLRVAVIIYQQSADRLDIFNFLIFLKITFESSADFYFSRNREKLNLAIDTHQQPLEKETNCA